MKFKIGTRGSALALAQAELLSTSLLKAHPSLELETVIIKTSGDKKQGTPAASQGDKRDWVQELEESILAGDIDVAIHSGKDLPHDLLDGTTASSVMKRANPTDCFIGKKLADGTRLSGQGRRTDASHARPIR